MKQQLRKHVQRHGNRIVSSMDAKALNGMRTRYWIAIAVAAIATIVDTVMVYYNYDYIPATIPLLSDWDSKILAWGSKSAFWDYEIQRIVLLGGCIGLGRLLCKLKPNSLIMRRTECLLVETASLIITTGVGVSIATLKLVMGDDTTHVSDYWETTIMLFWFSLLLVEYIANVVFLRKNYPVTKRNTRPTKKA